MSRSFKLFRLQQVDSQRDRAYARLQEIEVILGEDEALQMARQTLETAQENTSAAEKDLHRAEDSAKAQQIKIEQNQVALFGGKVSDPRELQDLQLEAEVLDRRLATLEDVQLEKMLALEESQNQLSAAQKELGEIEAQRTRQHGELGEERDALLEDVKRLDGEREAVSKGIPAEDMAVYEKLRESKAGLAVAKVNDKVCSACGTTLAHSLAQAARSPKEINTCSTCRRIIYAG